MVWRPIQRPDIRHRKDPVMSDLSASTTSAKPRTKPVPATYSAGAATPKFEIPRFDLPKFEMPKLEIPAAFREFAEKGINQAKDSWEKMKAATEEATDLIEGSYATASKGAADYGLKVIEAARTNTNATFDFAGELLTVKSLSEAVELSTAHMRKQFDALTEQSKELSALAQKIAAETTEPLKQTVTGAFKKVA